MTPIEAIGNLCGDKYMYTLPPIMSREEAAREILKAIKPVIEREQDERRTN